MNTLAPLDAKSAEERVLGWQTKLHRWAAQDEHPKRTVPGDQVPCLGHVTGALVFP